MKTAGIIAEFNPFHSGHKYLFDRAKTDLGADYIVVVMSGDFTQRGIPAVLSKQERTCAALMAGADLVLELPAVYAVASAEYFARGSISLLNSLGCVNTLVFGSEEGSLDFLQQIASFLNHESSQFKEELSALLKNGISYPASRAQALARHFHPVSGLDQFLSKPNNILAIEYLRALEQSHSTITPQTTKRIGTAYLSEEFEHTFPSASYLRSCLGKSSDSLKALDFLKEHGFASAEHIQEVLPLFTDDFSSLLLYKLILDKEKGFDSYLDISSFLSDRITGSLYSFKNITDFTELLKAKNYTYSHISRNLLHILLDMKKEDFAESLQQGSVPYGRILGFNKASGELLHAVKASSSIPIIAKPADAPKLLPAKALSMFQKDIFSSLIYQNGLCSRYPASFLKNDITASPVIV